MRLLKSFLRLLFLFSVILFSPSLLRAQESNTLGYFIETAQTNSPILNDYNNQVISNRIDSLRLRASYGFIFTGEGDGMYAPIVHGWGYDEVITNGQSFFAGARVTKQIIGNKNLKARLDSYRASIAQVLAQKGIVIKTLDKQITDQYIATYTNQQQYKLSEEIIALLNKEDDVLKELTRQSVFKQTDYLTFKVTLQQNQLTLQQQKADWQSNYLLLNYMAGVVDTSVHELSVPDTRRTFPAPAFEESVYAKVFQADSAKLDNDAKIIEYDYKPKISVFSDGGYQSSFTLKPYKNFGVSVGVAITLPLYDGHQKQMLLQQNQLALETKKNYIAQAEKQYQQQISQLHQQIKLYEQMIDTANEQIEYANTLVEANAKQLPTGDVRMVDFILSINNLLNLKANIIQYNNALFRFKNQLTYLIIQ
ncbi:MAG: TolC family protein [Chitinophagaceae bacterium]|nr:TolC family protein [Chitinophagaceae bacterium]